MAGQDDDTRRGQADPLPRRSVEGPADHRGRQRLADQARDAGWTHED